MDLITDLMLLESQKRANDEISLATGAINDIYTEWKKKANQRRRNAVDLVTMSVNKVSKIDPNVIDNLTDTARRKLAVIIMRCLDMPPWGDIEKKRVIYNRVYPLLQKVQREKPVIDNPSNLNDTICTRISSVISHKSPDSVFATYQPTSSKYLEYLFGEDIPENIIKMQTLAIPEDFDRLINIITINHGKACEQCKNKEVSK